MSDNWINCYKRGWGKELVPEAFAHPAKVSFSLAERIYAHLAEEDWVAEGSTVIDPFGGIGGCAYHALRHGLHFIGVELEPKFVDLAAQNIAMWNSRYAGRFIRWGTARIVQGDSRRLLDVVRDAGVCVSSPPFEGCHSVVPVEAHSRQVTSERVKSVIKYGVTDGQIGNDTGDTFWSSARVIVAQTFAALRPGGHAVWVVKSFVRNKAIVDFPDQWRELCESVGFVTLHEHHAMLVDDKGTQMAHDGNHKEYKTERKSFFRRLAEKKGSPRIDYETVLCMVKQ